MRFRSYIVFVMVAVLAGCQFREDTYVDFTDIDGASQLAFRVIGQHETDLSVSIPENCYLPDGTRLSEYSEASEAVPASESSNQSGFRRTSSVTGAGILQELLKYGNQKKVIEIVGTYPSHDADGNEITLSGKVMLPRDGNPKRMILVSHYTVCSNAEAPSNCFSIEGLLVKSGYGLIIPDYIGYGVTAKEVHPYLVMDLTARNVLDMYLAVRPWLEAIDRVPDDPELDLMGYSQGGATTMAVQHLIETEYDDADDINHVSLHRVFAGGGPYDVKATYERFVTTDTASYPVAVPLVLQGMIKGNKLNMQLEDMMQPWLCEHLDDWINSKRFSSAQINKLIGTKVTHNLLTEEAMEQKSDKVAELYKAMTVNSILSLYWEPEASVYIMHSMDDETVPFTNASNAKSKWQDANITYNFGHYGGHVMTCLRFIYAVQTLLQQEEDERKQYEQ
ncbi:MAG: hypothetical protein II901_04435 [Paludibacteraceae bacterium]|nr:hypothetical protein [Paludibacteraceae bacterium]